VAAPGTAQFRVAHKRPPGPSDGFDEPVHHRVAFRWWPPVPQRSDLRDPSTVGSNLIPVVRSDVLFGVLVPDLSEFSGVVEVGAHDTAQQLGVHQPDRV